MKKLLVFALCANAILLAGRFWQELPVAQGDGGGPLLDDRYCADANGDGSFNISDPVTLLNHLFTSSGQPPYCMAQGISLQGLRDTVAMLESRVTALESVPPALTGEQQEILGHLSIVQLPVDDEGGTAKTIRVTGVNVQIINGLGATNGNPADPFGDEGRTGGPDTTDVNGLGNLLIGYQETRVGPGRSNANDRSGSHNLVLGIRNNYSSFGGIVSGFESEVSGAHSLAVGYLNRATALYSSAIGGALNTASAESSLVAGGLSGIASAQLSSISGGIHNRASGASSVVSGGSFNHAEGSSATVSGGFRNIARGLLYSTVSGGQGNVATAEGEHVR